MVRQRYRQTKWRSRLKSRVSPPAFRLCAPVLVTVRPGLTTPSPRLAKLFLTQTKVLYAVQQPFHKALLTGKTKHAAWRSKPSFYAVSTEDRTINPDLERFMAKRMVAKIIEVKASHLSLISHPDGRCGL